MTCYFGYRLYIAKAVGLLFIVTQSVRDYCKEKSVLESMVTNVID